MSSIPITEEAIRTALSRLPTEQLPKVLAFIDSLQGLSAPSAPTAKCWTATELRRLPAAERDRILAEQAAALVEEYRHDPDLTDYEAFGEP